MQFCMGLILALTAMYATMALANATPGYSPAAATFSSQFIHLLGFTYSLFPLYINATTGTLLQSVTESVTNGNGLVTQVVTPTVVKEAQAQFNCPALTGAQLEDEGGSGSINSHW